MDKISVLVAAYNVEKHIEICLNSLKGQSHREIEIIIVNDASTDRTNEIVVNYMNSNRDLDIKYIIHETNRGSAAARKTALEHATGDFIHVLDADDFIMPDTYRNAVYNMKALACEICMWGWIELTESQDRLFEYQERFHYFDGILSGAEVCKRKICRWLWICSGSALYSSELVRKNEPVFFQGLNMGEDFYFICKLLINCKRVCCLSEQNFRCVNRSGSMTHHMFSEQHSHPFELFRRFHGEAEQSVLLNKKEKEEIQAWVDAECRRTYIAYAKLACQTFYNRSVNEILSAIAVLGYCHKKIPKPYLSIIGKKNKIEYVLMHGALRLYCIMYKTWLIVRYHVNEKNGE